MSDRDHSPRRVAVLDVGKTNVKVVLFDRETGTEAGVRTTPNAVATDGPYPHVDVASVQAFVLDALADLARGEGFDAVSITAHGAAGALVLPDGELALPVLDYEHDGPDRLRDAYDRVRPPFAETFSPRLPGGLNLGAQLFWQAKTFPDAFAGGTVVTYPQYWAFWLTGVLATEPTSLGCHTDLWAPREGRFSSLVDAMGWGSRLAPTRSAFDRLGPIRPDLARRLGVRRPIPVACGIHDSNASLLPHLQGEAGARAVVSTGTWAIVFAPGGSLEGLDPARDTLANVDAYGRPVPSGRFMGGREYDILTAGSSGLPDAATVRDVLDRQVMALPTFAPGTGPYPQGAGRWSHDPGAMTASEREAAASLYLALMITACLALLAAQGPIVIEGPFARNRLVVDALAHLTGRPVHPAGDTTGTSAGAARLLLPRGAGPVLPGSPPPTFRFGSELASYAARWRQSVASAETARQ